MSALDRREFADRISELARDFDESGMTETANDFRMAAAIIKDCVNALAKREPVPPTVKRDTSDRWAFADYLTALESDLTEVSMDPAYVARDLGMAAAMLKDSVNELHDAREDLRRERSILDNVTRDRDGLRVSLFNERDRNADVLRRVVRQRDKLQSRLDHIAAAVMHGAHDDGK